MKQALIPTHISIFTTYYNLYNLLQPLQLITTPTTYYNPYNLLQPLQLITTPTTYFNPYNLSELTVQRLLYLSQYKGEPVDLYLISSAKQHAKLAGRESLGLQPLQVVNRQIAY